MVISRRIALLAPAAIALAACADSTTNNPQGASQGPNQLVIYSPQGEGPRGEYIKKAALDELGTTVEFVSGGGGELTSRLLSEKNNAQADVVLGLGQSQLYQLDREQIFGAFTPAWSDQVTGNFKVATAGFTLFSQTPIVMARNPAHLGEADAPKRWEDLADPAYAKKFTLPGPKSQTGQAFIVGLLWRYADPATGNVSDEGWTVLKSVFDNAVPLGEGATLDWGLVKNGEIPLVVNWLGGVQTSAKDNDIEMATINPVGGSPFVNAGIGIVQNTDKRELAEKFVNWFGSPEFQSGFVRETNSDLPISPEALAELPTSMTDAAAKVDPQPIDWAIVSEQLTGWLQRVELDVI